MSGNFKQVVSREWGQGIQDFECLLLRAAVPQLLVSKRLVVVEGRSPIRATAARRSETKRMMTDEIVGRGNNSTEIVVRKDESVQIVIVHLGSVCSNFFFAPASVLSISLFSFSIQRATPPYSRP